MNTFDRLAFRSFAGKSDFAKMARLLQDIAIADQADFLDQPENVQRNGHNRGDAWRRYAKPEWRFRPVRKMRVSISDEKYHL